MGMKKILYRVNEKDTAAGVAEKFGASVTRLIRDNNLTGEIEAGDVLLVEKTGKSYTVNLGESYSSLAKKFDVSERELAEKNGNPPYLYYGQKINV